MCQSQMNQIQYSDIHFYCLTATAPDKKKDMIIQEYHSKPTVEGLRPGVI